MPDRQTSRCRLSTNPTITVAATDQASIAFTNTDGEPAKSTAMLTYFSSSQNASIISGRSPPLLDIIMEPPPPTSPETHALPFPWSPVRRSSSSPHQPRGVGSPAFRSSAVAADVPAAQLLEVTDDGGGDYTFTFDTNITGGPTDPAAFEVTITPERSSEPSSTR
jgi:hypothetical protein